ncbi:cysteine synthase A [Pseudoxanthomonas sp.]|uniref:cysteine synthase A n=1 Tax=Pseudoxanthomonas sp. TaxID=1871049 RepID=UPI0026374C39|nr:cysteine synthase A [Pseudoxanthomonas sp.]WDS36530.1 MAG: cysteine synthase A [Pseudoxanthomonas sp.]
MSTTFQFQPKNAVQAPRQDAPVASFRGRVYDSILDTIGATPLVRFDRLAAEEGVRAHLVGKLEFFNPLASVKDRLGAALIEAAEREGRLKPGSVIIEPTSGNTGIGLAFVAAAKGYALILCMPESMSIERRKMVQHLGARIELTPAAERMSGAIRRANELQAQIPNAVVLQQFENPANPAAHRATTAEEIWRDSDGQVDAFVAGVGTGGTITGVGQVLKRYNPAVQIVAVEPEGSATLSGGKAGPHAIQGIGSGHLSTFLDRSVIDAITTVSDADALRIARRLARLEGVPVGISAGAALWAAIQLGRREESAGKTIVVLIPDFAERYLSTELFDAVDGDAPSVT